MPTCSHTAKSDFLASMPIYMWRNWALCLGMVDKIRHHLLFLTFFLIYQSMHFIGPISDKEVDYCEYALFKHVNRGF